MGNSHDIGWAMLNVYLTEAEGPPGRWTADNARGSWKPIAVLTTGIVLESKDLYYSLSSHSVWGQLIYIAILDIKAEAGSNRRITNELRNEGMLEVKINGVVQTVSFVIPESQLRFPRECKVRWLGKENPVSNSNTINTRWKDDRAVVKYWDNNHLSYEQRMR